MVRVRVWIAVGTAVVMVGAITAARVSSDRRGVITDEATAESAAWGKRSLRYVGATTIDGEQSHIWTHEVRGEAGPLGAVRVQLIGEPGRWQVRGAVVKLGECRWELVPSPWSGNGDYPAEATDERTGVRAPVTVHITIRGVP